MPHTHPNDDWRHGAACQNEDPELFFPVSDVGPSEQQIARAKAFCHGCPVIQECLGEALRDGLDFGIWGGTTEWERRAMKEKQHARSSMGQLALKET